MVLSAPAAHNDAGRVVSHTEHSHIDLHKSEKLCTFAAVF